MKRKIIIIGGGFSGLQLAQNLDRKLFDILLIDKLNHHQFQPLFYQVATSQLEPSSISFPFRKVLQHKREISIRLAEVLNIKSSENLIQTTIGEFQYDYLVIATGCRTNFFGNDEIKKHAFTLKTTYQAINIRNSILESFEKIIYADEKEKESLLNIVIVGGGPTGVELSGAFAEIKRYILPKDYPGIDFSKLHITLLEGSPHTLNNMSSMAKKMSEKYLKDLGVVVRTGMVVKNFDGKIVTLANGEQIPSRNLIWAAGIYGNLVNGLPPEIVTNSGRIKVDRTNGVVGWKNIYAIGDIAFMETPKYQRGHPQVANVAINQGKLLAKNLKAVINNKKTTPYEYNDLGSMATIGRNKAVVDLPFWKFSGRLAWFVWMVFHLMFILSVRNKLIIFINWAFSYLTKDTSLRLILKGDISQK